MGHHCHKRIYRFQPPALHVYMRVSASLRQESCGDEYVEQCAIRVDLSVSTLLLMIPIPSCLGMMLTAAALIVSVFSAESNKGCHCCVAPNGRGADTISIVLRSVPTLSISFPASREIDLYVLATSGEETVRLSARASVPAADAPSEARDGKNDARCTEKAGS
ncbi:hypothetical protein BV25DRAFT_137398 [Artomyces pyxidatus]|uniref:Uncharacterized protein n=1 Tax=Artomyces pyxidatus TaxID=48021 RepID=A0ACB8T8B0_9AGAM|nr:hypothetical protein BV25DRAFT_137398 [Artomyces pyxidatus]